MAAPKGHPKWGGRKKGSANQDTQAIEERAQELGVSPFEVLLLFAKGDWQNLGYAAKCTTKWTGSGIEYEEDVITPQMRLLAAKEACQYLYPKRKAIEIGQELTPEEQVVLQMFREKMKAYAEEQTRKAIESNAPKLSDQSKG
jgi:hypothetical protein